MSTPTTREEIESAIIGASSGYVLSDDRERLVNLVWGWLSECRANATPLIRLVTETPQVGDRIAVHNGTAGWRVESCDRGGNVFHNNDDGWVLLDRRKPKTLAEEARELLARRSPEAARYGSNWAGADELVSFIRRVAEGEHDE